MDIMIRSSCETDEGDAYTLSASLKSSSKFTDFIIRTTENEFKVHKMVICGQSEFFSCLFDEEWKETTDNSIDLMNDDPRTIEAMIYFMYESDYDSSGNSQGRISPMLFNAKVYGVAEKYGVSRLKQEAKAKFEDAVRTCWDMDDFTPTIMEVYTSTISTDRGLRDVLVDTTSTHIKSLLQKGPFVLILEECAGFSADVIQLLARRLPTRNKYTCPSCRSKWEGKLPGASGKYHCLICGYAYSNWSQHAS